MAALTSAPARFCPTLLLLLSLLAVCLLPAVVWAHTDDAASASSFLRLNPLTLHNGALSAFLPSDSASDELPAPQTATAGEVASGAQRRFGSMTDIVLDDSNSSSSRQDSASSAAPSRHHWQSLQAGSVFDMTRLCTSAPWSVRIQPGLSYRRRPVTYQQPGSNINIRLQPGYLLLYEGGMNTLANGTNFVENDVWVSNDDGASWDLIAGHSLFGRSGAVTSNRPNTFLGRRGSNNCADPLSDVVLSLGGVNPLTNNATTVNYHSFDGEQWNQRQGSFQPGRHFSSCDIDESGHAFVIAGHYSNTNVPQDRLLNDVWITNALWTWNPWRLVTANAPFSVREEHLVLVANSTTLHSEIIYVMGGKVTCGDAICYDGTMINDVWASSDSGVTWSVISATPPWGPRWGHGGWVSRDGVLLVWGGLDTPTGLYGDTYTRRDMWASFDGGYTWNACNLPSNPRFLRGEQGVAVNAYGRLVLVAGYAYLEDGITQRRYNDVWRSNSSVENTADLASKCGGAGVIPAAGPGLRRWPSTAAAAPNTLTFTPLTRRAPWSPRIQPALLLMSQPRQYTNPADGSTANTGPNWLLLYEGSLSAVGSPIVNENDVYASADNGATWTLISGIARTGAQQANVQSAHPSSSFHAMGGSGNCEDPTSDDVYALGGLSYNSSGAQLSNEVWYSSDAVYWSLRTGRSFTPGRYFHSCDVDTHSRVFVIGGQADGANGGLLNDVWVSSTKGQTWTRVTARAPFPARSEHAVQVTTSDYYGVDLIYVMGGFVWVNNAYDTSNDVWVSSDSAVTWKQLVARATWSKRWGHGAAITAAGAMLVLGGTSNDDSVADMWLSLNGGIRWTACRLPVNGGFIRGEQAVALTADERLIVGNGYRYVSNPPYRTEYSDLWSSDVSFSNAATLARACGSAVPEEGVGLRGVEDWTPQSSSNSSSDATTPASESSSSAFTTVLIVALVLLCLAMLAALAFAYRHKQRTGSWNVFAPAAAPIGMDGSSLLPLDTSVYYGHSDTAPAATGGANGLLAEGGHGTQLSSL